MKPNRCKAHNRTLSLLSLASPHSSSTTPSSRSICHLAQRSSPWINSDLDGLFQSCSQLQCLVLGGSLTRHTVHSIWICDGGAVERKAPSLLCSGACMFRGHNTARESGCNSSCHTKFRRRMDQLMDPTRSHPSTPRHAPLHAPLKHWTKYSWAPISTGAIGESAAPLLTIRASPTDRVNNTRRICHLWEFISSLPSRPPSDLTLHHFTIIRTLLLFISA